MLNIIFVVLVLVLLGKQGNLCLECCLYTFQKYKSMLIFLIHNLFKQAIFLNNLFLYISEGV